MLKEFRDFAMRGNVIDLAVGIIIGAAFTSVVSSLVKDIIMPPIGYLMNGIDFSNFFLVLKGEDYPSLKAAQDAGAVSINYGVFINAIINFLIVAFAVFLLVKQVNPLQETGSRRPGSTSRPDHQREAADRDPRPVAEAIKLRPSI